MGRNVGPYKPGCYPAHHVEVICASVMLAAEAVTARARAKASEAMIRVSLVVLIYFPHLLPCGRVRSNGFFQLFIFLKRNFTRGEPPFEDGQ